MIKATGKPNGWALRVAATICLAIALLGLPYLHYSRAHLHVFNGAVVAHWHPDSGLEQTTPGNKNPVAGHTHSLSDLFNLWHIEKSQGDPACQQQVLVQYSLECEIPVTDQFILSTGSLRTPVGRSPPNVLAVL